MFKVMHHSTLICHSNDNVPKNWNQLITREKYLLHKFSQIKCKNRFSLLVYNLCLSWIYLVLTHFLYQKSWLWKIMIEICKIIFYLNNLIKTRTIKIMSIMLKLYTDLFDIMKKNNPQMDKQYTDTINAFNMWKKIIVLLLTVLLSLSLVPREYLYMNF